MQEPPTPITYFNRHTGQLETEAIYGEAFLRWIYGSPSGKLALWALVRRAVFSHCYGWLMNRPASARKVAPFIAKFGLDETEFAQPTTSYRTFNEFFSRKLKPSTRPIDATPESVAFPADGRHLLVPDVSAVRDFFVKGQRFDLGALIGPDVAAEFAGGSALISRLCPTDYHRFHFPCDCTPSAPTQLSGALFSVSPLAIAKRPSILWENKRFVTRLRLPERANALYLEIGATCVGTVHHTSDPGQFVTKGAEKGTFLFGGSCVILLFQTGAVEWASDLAEQSSAGRELYARMGSVAGHFRR